MARIVGPINLQKLEISAGLIDVSYLTLPLIILTYRIIPGIIKYKKKPEREFKEVNPM